jgi:aspartyl-tRNA(Asn)/glutamyl-tRNA(Gln) amidotransferase subunit C
VKIDEAMVRHLAALCKLDLTDAEIQTLIPDLAEIVKYIESLQDLDTAGVEPTYQVGGLQNVWQDDVVAPQIPRENLLALAPDAKNNQVKVPKVL